MLQVKNTIQRRESPDDLCLEKRKKNDKLIKLPIQPKANELIVKYHNSENPYLFPILFGG